MRVEVMEHYRLTQPLSQAGYYETRHHQQLIKDIKSAILEGRLIALCGVIGELKRLFDIGGFSQLFVICPTRAECIAKVGPAAPQ